MKGYFPAANLEHRHGENILPYIFEPLENEDILPYIFEPLENEDWKAASTLV